MFGFLGGIFGSSEKEEEFEFEDNRMEWLTDAGLHNWNDSGDQRYQVDGKEIVVCSLSKAMRFTSDVPWAAISITSADYPPADMKELGIMANAYGWPELNEDNRVGLLQVAFPDYEFRAENLDDKLFNKSHAEEILEFVELVWPKIDAMLVHCHAGMSRSPAVAAAISNIKTGTYKQFWEHHMPNTLVFEELNKVAGKTI